MRLKPSLFKNSKNSKFSNFSFNKKIQNYPKKFKNFPNSQKTKFFRSSSSTVFTIWMKKTDWGMMETRKKISKIWRKFYALWVSLSRELTRIHGSLALCDYSVWYASRPSPIYSIFFRLLEDLTLYVDVKVTFSLSWDFLHEKITAIEGLALIFGGEMGTRRELNWDFWGATFNGQILSKLC